MTIVGKVRKRVRKFFNRESIDAKTCRDVMIMGLLGFTMMELMVAFQLQHSADLGELPQTTTDAVLIGISSVEVLIAPLLCWVGMQRRRSVIFGWNLLALIATISMFVLPRPDTTPVDGLCSVVSPRSLPTGVSLEAGVRLAMLIICGLIFALGRTAIMGHSLAYINEHTPSVNLHMHVGVLILNRVVGYLVGSALKDQLVEKPWMQQLILIVQSPITLLRLYTYPEVSPRLEKLRCSDRGLFRSMARVLSNEVVVLITISMALLTAAWGGFLMNETNFIQVKFNFRPELDSDSAFITALIKVSPVILGVVLGAYMYTEPVMVKYDRKAAVANASRMCIRSAVVFIMLMVVSCTHGGIEGAGDPYNQPACGGNCSCDRPWMEYTPVCEQEQMKTYFSPCHAGCSSTEIINSVSVYSNCTCAPGGRVTVGPCTDGSCNGVYVYHQMLVILLSILVTMALVWMVTVVLEIVDKRDVGVAVGIMASAVSLVAFVGAQGFYMGITSFTCIFNRGSKCLLQNSQFVHWVGYSSIVLCMLAFIIGIIAYIILRRQKEPDEEVVTDLETL